MSDAFRIERKTPIREILRRYPDTLSVFQCFGVDPANSDMTIADAAENEFVEPGRLVAALRGSVRGQAQPVS